MTGGAKAFGSAEFGGAGGSTGTPGTLSGPSQLEICESLRDLFYENLNLCVSQAQETVKKVNELESQVVRFQEYTKDLECQLNCYQNLVKKAEKLACLAKCAG